MKGSDRTRTHSLRDDFSKDDNHGRRYDDGCDAAAKNIVEEDWQRFIDNLLHN